MTTLEQAKPKTTPKSPQETADEILRDESAKFVGYSQEFLDMAESYQDPDNIEHQIASELSTIAEREWERLDAADTLLRVYRAGTCAADSVRATSRGLVSEQLSLASKYTDLEIKSTSNDLTHTKMPGMAVLANCQQLTAYNATSNCVHGEWKAVPVPLRGYYELRR